MSITDFDDPDEVDDPEFVGVKRSTPLSLRWRFVGRELVESLPLPKAPSVRHQSALERIAALAYKVMRKDPAGEISFGRSNSDYVGQQHYQGRDYTLPTVAWAVEALEGAGLVEEFRAKPGSRGWRSTIRPRPLLAELVAAAVPQTPSQSAIIAYNPIQLIHLRDRAKRRVLYRETAISLAARRNLEGINEMMRSTSLSMAAGEITEAGVYLCNKEDGTPVTADLRAKEYHRVFTWDFGKGGRLYGVGWQNLPKELRAKILIDGEPVAEHDFEAQHAVLLYAHIGKAIPPEPFHLPDWPRPIVKRAFYTMVNADSSADARGAIQLDIMRKALAADGQAGKRTGELMALIERKHAAVRGYFYSGIGRLLQRHDSNVAERVILDAQGRGVAALSVHDSFIAQERHSDLVRQFMDDNLVCELRRINPDAPKPQPVPPLWIVLPQGCQLDMFGELFKVRVPIADLKSWQRGIMPETVCNAVRHEIRRRGLRQEEAADEVGVSRPQLANALQRRFGLGPDAVERVKAMIEEAAAA